MHLIYFNEEHIEALEGFSNFPKVTELMLKRDFFFWLGQSDSQTTDLSTIQYYFSFICTLMFIVSLSTTDRIWKQPKCLTTEEGKKKLWYIYTMEYFAATRKIKALQFTATWMELDGLMLSKQARGREQTQDDPTHLWYAEEQINEWTISIYSKFWTLDYIAECQVELLWGKRMRLTESNMGI